MRKFVSHVTLVRRNDKKNKYVNKIQNFRFSCTAKYAYENIVKD